MVSQWPRESKTGGKNSNQEQNIEARYKITLARAMKLAMKLTMIKWGLKRSNSVKQKAAEKLPSDSLGRVLHLL